MLAQGDFTKFLQSKESEKSDILEKLTGTSIYSEIGCLLYTSKGVGSWGSVTSGTGFSISLVPVSYTHLFQNIRFFAFLALQELGEVALRQHGGAAELFEGQPHCSLYFRLYLILFVELCAAFIVFQCPAGGSFADRRGARQ